MFFFLWDAHSCHGRPSHVHLMYEYISVSRVVYLTAWKWDPMERGVAVACLRRRRRRGRRCLSPPSLMVHGGSCSWRRCQISAKVLFILRTNRWNQALNIIRVCGNIQRGSSFKGKQTALPSPSCAKMSVWLRIVTGWLGSSFDLSIPHWPC